MIEATIALLGRRASDKVTGYKGVITSACFDLYGCVQLSISPPMGADGKLEHGHWFDVHRVKVEKGRAVMPVPDFKAVATKPEDYDHGPAPKPAPGAIGQTRAPR